MSSSKPSTNLNSGETVHFNVTGMDCGKCAAKIESEIRKINGILDVTVSIVTQIATVRVESKEAALAVPGPVEKIGYRVSQIDAGSTSEKHGTSRPATHTIPAYRKALIIVVLLNLGFGCVEIVGGFLAGSQALKADALDFIGDGLITLLAVIAIGWLMIWRARAALLQGVFLGLLGTGIIANTIYRMFIMQTPVAELMGIFGFIALAVNVASAAVLMPHRAGDSNVRAVWLFSRNDAIANIAVLIAAVFVAWFGSPLPDLVVAAVVAGLFLQSSWLIIKDSRRELNSISM